jgi:hypothetical protein
MSIIQTLKKIVDPIRAREEERDRKSRRAQHRREVAGAGPPQEEVEPPRFVCRVCNQISSEGSYCPHCLSDTMSPVPPTDPADKVR